MRAIIGTDPEEAARRLAMGQLVALPTETVYGLGGNALNPRAVSGVFTAKNRPSFDPLILHQSSSERILAYAQQIPHEARRLAEALWPGPLTLVLPRVSSVPDLVTAGLDTVALRVPSHPLIREVLERVDFPVAAPSANPFGFVSPVTAAHVADQLGDRIDYILDGGTCRVGLESTIVGFAGGAPTVLRKGGTAVEDIESVLGRSVEVRTLSSSRPTAPGMLVSHYSPGIALTLVEVAAEAGTAERAVVRFGDANGAGGQHEYNLSVAGDLEEAARNLFTVLRRLAAGGYRSATVELVPERGLGRAINDRLRRASN
ncbi:L-threonylcarbamoyladenylate synthase [Lewinella aquimaris]|uniref:Threonylcarbamoyl-AMP synthase n=1 Tax=Neolewinella aquimaris TaxID=1835722 RepID=A0A840E5Q3_9BACT|nr:L-threonylcarbamoyladenylate synthase [Neolewinella aquimaris]MBB4078497.1 L-threonylcarbamoyladenylate synthase [Neolewinella aquimaris]